MYPNWDFAFGGAALPGLVLAIAGVIAAMRKGEVAVFSMIGGILSLAPTGFMLFVIALGYMH